MSDDVTALTTHSRDGLLRVTALGDDGTVVVTCVGEVDLCTAQAFARQAGAALDTCTISCVVDLSGVSFFSAAGVRVLLELHRRAVAADVAFEVRSPSDIVRYVLSLVPDLAILPMTQECVAVGAAPAGARFDG